MRTITIILLTVLSCVTAWAGDKNTTIVVRPITEKQRSEIPDKTLTVKLQRYTINDTPLGKAVVDLVSDVRKDDLYYNFYVLKFHTTQDGVLEVGVIGENRISPAIQKKAWGVMFFDSVCFVLLDEKPDGLFTKAKGKQTIIQEFEIVDDSFHKSTDVFALWKDGKLRANVYHINGSDLLQKRKRKEDGNIMVDHFE